MCARWQGSSVTVNLVSRVIICFASAAAGCHCLTGSNDANSRVSSHQWTPVSAFSGCWFISWHLCAFEHTYLCDCCTETGICCAQKWSKGNSRFKRWCVWSMCLLIQPDSGLCVFECACRMLQRSTVPSSVRCSRSFMATRPSNVLTGRAFTTPCRTAIGCKGVSNAAI